MGGRAPAALSLLSAYIGLDTPNSVSVLFWIIGKLSVSQDKGTCPEVSPEVYSSSHLLAYTGINWQQKGPARFGAGLCLKALPGIDGFPIL